jgi:biotin operon repressor
MSMLGILLHHRTGSNHSSEDVLIVLPHPQVAKIIAWFADVQSRISNVVMTILLVNEGASHSSDSLVAKIALAPLGGTARGELKWGSWLESSARAELVETRTALGLARAELKTSSPFAPFEDELKSVMAAVPETLAMGAPAPEDPSEETQSIDVPLRRWLELAFVQPALTALAALQTTVEQAIDETIARVEDVEKVVDYYTLAVQRQAAESDDVEGSDELARAGRGRLRALIDDVHRARRGRGRRAVGAFVRSTADALDDATAPLRSHRADALARALADLERRQEAKPRSPVVRRLVDRTRETYLAAAPLLAELSVDLRAVFADEASDATRRAYLALLDHAPAEVGRQLPASYRRLFASLPIQIADMYQRRLHVESACQQAFSSWRRGAPQTVLLHGDRGAGKRTVLNHVLARVRTEASVRWVRLSPRLCDEGQVTRAIAVALALEGEHSSFGSIAKLVGTEQSRRVVVIENAERLLSHSPAGVDRLSAFLRLVGSTAHTTLWLLLMATPAAMLLLHRLELAHRVPTIIALDPMSPDELRAMILSRHRLSGFELEFVQPPARIADYVRHPLSTLREHRAASDTFFGRLHRLTQGNPRQAMLYWLASLRPHPQREGRIVVAPMPEATVGLLLTLSVAQRLALGLLAQHATLSSEDLAEALACSRDVVESDLQTLWAKGYLSPSREQDGHWGLHPTMAHPLLMELRSVNMI